MRNVSSSYFWILTQNSSSAYFYIIDSQTPTEMCIKGIKERFAEFMTFRRASRYYPYEIKEIRKMRNASLSFGNLTRNSI